MGLFRKKDKGLLDLEKILSAGEMKAVSYAVYYITNSSRDREGMELANLLVSGKRRRVFPEEYAYVTASAENMIEVMEVKKRSGSLDANLPQELLDDLNSALPKLKRNLPDNVGIV